MKKVVLLLLTFSLTIFASTDIINLKAEDKGGLIKIAWNSTVEHNIKGTTTF